jgi:hypothetical protein
MHRNARSNPRALGRVWSAAVLGGTLVLPVACAADAGGACANDLDCKGDRLCMNGQCIDPGGDGTLATSTESEAGTTTTMDPGTTAPDSTTNSTSTTAMMTTTEASESSTSVGESTGDPGQPYGLCRLECESSAECCAELGCESGTAWTCEDGLCRPQCVAAECNPIASVIFDCVTPTIDIPGASFCGATCENSCSDVINDPAYYCNMDAGYEPEICSFDCGIDPTVCNGSNGTACLPDGTCGCYEPGECAPGYVCFKNWG